MATSVEIPSSAILERPFTLNERAEETCEYGEIRIMENDHRGMFAKEDLRMGAFVGVFAPLSTFDAGKEYMDMGIAYGMWASRIGYELYLIRDTEKAKKIVHILEQLHPRDVGLDGLKQKLMMNAFRTKNTLELYWGLSMLNHSCAPNCTVFDGIIRTRRNIAKGEELNYIYNLGSTHEETRRNLLIDYEFDCKCTACRGIEEPVTIDFLRVVQNLAKHLDETKAKTRCHNGLCDKVGKSRCGKCQKARYCSRECQSSDWKQHKIFCKKEEAAAEPKSQS